MTDQTSGVSEFSFRTFDIYRRFVEVLQCKPSYLKEFKTGTLTEETCRAVVKKVFQSQQQEEDIKKYIQYFFINAKMMAGHAENLPDDWNNAIDYTDRYIKEIRKYLRRKTISIRLLSSLDSVDDIAKRIAEYIHNSPTVKQIEAIRCYLKYDLCNPKRNIISSNSPKKSKIKTDKTIKSFVKSESQIKDDKIGEAYEITFIQKEDDQSSLAYEGAYESALEAPLSQQIKIEEDNNEEVMETPLKFENIETEIVNDFEMTDSGVLQYKVDMYGSDNFHCEQNVMSPELNLSNSFVGIENSSAIDKIERTGGVAQTLKTNTITNSSLSRLKRINEDRDPNYNFHFKRKSSSPFENDYYYSLKKQLQSCRRIPKNLPQKSIVTPSRAIHIKSNNSDNSSDSEITVDNDSRSGQISRFLMMNQYEESNESESKTSIDSEISEQMENSIFNLKSKIRDMNYADAVKHIDLATTFCKLKNVITQDELLVMQQIREKMYLKSLTERSTM